MLIFIFFFKNVKLCLTLFYTILYNKTGHSYNTFGGNF